MLVMHILCLVSEPEFMYPVNSIKISKVAKKINSEYYETEDINTPEVSRYLASLEPDVIFSTWPRLIHKCILDIPKYGVIGTHPTALPFNRGRHPLHWLIVLGIKKSMLSFFVMEEGIDTGAILHQEPFSIDEHTSVKELSEKLNNITYNASIKVGDIINNTKAFVNAKKQDDVNSNSWRKRTLFDVTIDFRMKSKDILSLVRSFNEPFLGAIIISHNGVYHIKDAFLTENNNIPENIKNIEHGKILGIGKNLIRVKTSDHLIDLITKEQISESLKSITYLHPPIKYLVENQKLAKYLLQ